MKWLLLLLVLPVSVFAKQCGKTMDTSLVSDGCVCPIGKDWRYGKCVSNGLPEFAIDDDNGSWRCIEGYVKKAARCEKYIVPMADSKVMKVAVLDSDSERNSSKNCKLPTQFQKYFSNKQNTQP
jgi:hypothetical protein